VMQASTEPTGTEPTGKAVPAISGQENAAAAVAVVETWSMTVEAASDSTEPTASEPAGEAASAASGEANAAELIVVETANLASQIRTFFPTRKLKLHFEHKTTAGCPH
jgi:hypothetical protein